MRQLPILCLLFVGLYGLAACDKHDRGDHDHADDHDHGSGEGHDEHAHGEGDHGDHGHADDHDHGSGEGHDEHAHGDHDHDHGPGIVAGPNAGRVLTGVEPHLEFLVTADRKVELRQVSEQLKAEPIGTQTVSLVAGDRSNPTELSFSKVGDLLVSSGFLPGGNDFPVVVNIKASADGETVREKFNLNLAECPSCDNLEYACECDHEH